MHVILIHSLALLFSSQYVVLAYIKTYYHSLAFRGNKMMEVQQNLSNAFQWVSTLREFGS